ncbi:histidine kinase dimerization/phosphoacceptor domain -containing protein [Methylomonas sp. AM2-LC]|uniref:sensor histidine kinase n=1 Tax=Methylomonas sp. AM2-LC TaxID=3153301 RepID=UPI0032677A32
MAFLHEKLYQSNDLARIDFNDYTKGLVNYLLFGYEVQSEQISVDIRVVDVFLDVNTAIPCGLIINKLLTNALKHAFPHNRPRTIQVSFAKLQDNFVLEIADNGIAVLTEQNLRKSPSLGLQLVEFLTNHLLGNMTMDTTTGCKFTLQFCSIS